MYTSWMLSVRDMGINLLVLNETRGVHEEVEQP
jgi:hypothetical protein